MKAFLDERALTIARPTVAGALEAARAAAQAGGRIVVEVLIDGQPAPGHIIDNPSDGPAGEIELKCITADPRALVRQSFEEVATALESARVVQEEAAGALQQGKMDDAFALLSEIVGVWDAVRRVVEQGPALIGARYGVFKLTPGDGSPADLEQQLTDLAAVLQQVKSTVSGADWAALADLLQAELDQRADRWVTLLRQMAAQVGALPLAGGAGVRG